MKTFLKVIGYSLLAFVALGMIAAFFGDGSINTTERVVNTQVLNVRDGPGGEFDKIGEKEKGKTIEVQTDSSGWLEFAYDTSSGWVKKDFTVSTSKWERLQAERRAKSGGKKTKSSSNEDERSQNKATGRNKPDLQVINHDFSKENQFSSYIEGKIKNNTSQDYSYVQVSITLYDNSGAQIGSAMDNISNLEANGVWKFKAMATQQNIARYKIQEVTGY